jgi:glycosyltransferase involved in cell wall biosynthesis
MLSIVVPTFNSRRHLSRCLDSIRRQTYRDFEVVLIDGASTDGTLELLRDYAREDARLKLFSEPDQGIYDAYNKGIERASGEWIHFLGSDDELHSDRTLEQISPYLNSHYDLVYGNVLMRGDASWAKSGAIFDGEYSLEKLGRQNISHQAVFYRRTLFDRHGRYDLRYKVLADWAFNLRVFRRSRKKYVDLVIANFYAGGLSTQRRDETFQEHYFDLVRECYDFAPFNPFFSTYSYLLPRLAVKLRREHRYGRALQYWFLHLLHTFVLRWTRKRLGS